MNIDLTIKELQILSNNSNLTKHDKKNVLRAIKMLKMFNKLLTIVK